MEFITAFLLLQSLNMILANGNASNELNDFVTANNDFGLKLYKGFMETEQGNIIFSPLSISLALAMTSLGARGQTLEEIRRSTFTSGFPEEQIHRHFQRITKVVSVSDENEQVSIANKLYAQKGFKIIPSFLRSSRRFYASKLEAVDFSKNLQCASLINNWVSKKTNKKITEIVKPDDLTALTRLVLVNALYFKADWSKTFVKRLTKPQNFYITPKNSIKTEFLYDPESEAFYGIHETLHFEVLEKAFESQKFRFGIILPSLAKTSLRTVEKKLSADILNSLKMHSATVNITIPKFKINSNFELSGNLQELGIHELFVEGKAELSGIEKSKKLFVSKVPHKAIVEINENGVVAAASTAVMTGLTSVFRPPVRITIFRADHPFLFYIKHVNTGSILFLGRFSKP